MLTLLLACAAPDPEPRETGGDIAPDDTAPADSAPDDTAPPCAPPSAVTVTGTVYPGETVTVTATGASEPVTWTAEAGTLTPVDDASASWALPTDVAEHTPKTLTVTAAACGGEASAEVSLDWAIEDRVVVVYNPLVAGSEDVALAWADFRALPDAALCPVEASNDTEIAADEWAGFVAAVQACIDARGPQVMYVVPVWGVPYKVSGLVHDIGYPDAVATVSLDALLVYGVDSATSESAVWSPLYREGDSTTQTYDPYVPFPDLRRSLRFEHDRLYLVTRIDGNGRDAAIELVERTRRAEEAVAAGTLSGTVYVDGNRGDTPPTTDDFGSYESGEWNMWGTRYAFEADGRYPVVWDGNAEEFGTAPAPTSCPDALYYAGWYSYYHYNDAFTWTVGAIGGHLDSCSACDIRGGTTWSAMALQRGITATFGAVNEPYVAGMPEYDQFFVYLLQGANYAEAAYESTAIGRWMMVWVGDPFYRPYPASRGA